jgi:hypothetical protein
MWASVVPPLLCLMAFPIEFFFSCSSISRKDDMAKILGPFDVWKVPKSQKHAKTNKNLLRSVKTK